MELPDPKLPNLPSQVLKNIVFSVSYSAVAFSRSNRKWAKMPAHRKGSAAVRIISEGTLPTKLPFRYRRRERGDTSFCVGTLSFRTHRQASKALFLPNGFVICPYAGGEFTEHLACLALPHSSHGQ